MINRRIIRIKVIQILFSYYQSENNSLPEIEKDFSFGIKKLYDLYYYIFLLLFDIVDITSNKIEKAKKKLAPSKEDLNPNTKFIDNKFIKQLKQIEQIKQFFLFNKLSWINYPEVTKKVLQSIKESEEYKNYMQSSDNSYEADKKFIIFILEKVIYNCEIFYQILEEQSIFWSDNIEFVIAMVAKTLKNITIRSDELSRIMDKFKNSSDLTFSKELLRKTIINKKLYRDLIEENIINWDYDRLAAIDIIILQTAIAEIMNFENIPIKASFNEYIEISKIYSTKKSSVFINGILDKIIKKLKDDNQIVKSGRGLK